MTQLVHVLPRTYSTRRMALLMTLAAGLAVASTLAVLGLTAGGHKRPASTAHVYTAPKHAFAIAYPSGWQALSAWQGLVLRRADRKGIIVVRPSALPAGEPLSKLAGQITAELKKRFTDFRLVNSRVARTRGGAGFLYTFARTKAGLVQSILVARAGKQVYSLYAVAPAANPLIARQTGQILGTFGHG
jgi:hypothetical protein